MKKALVLIFVFAFLMGFSPAQTPAGEVSLKVSGEGQWAILDSGGQQIGTLGKVEPDAYSILPTGGQYLGIVKSNGDLQLTGRHPTISPSDAQLYLEVLEAIKTLKR
ncbi:MAG TPA: hypothetical protein VEF34_12415 [Syntrophobacteraceae bacterium]|nr:hypothetical protein [Syntrophobacteraceae bacterium]